MITNLPEELNINDFSRNLNLGSSDAKSDRLLEFCFCEIDPVVRFLEGNHDILLGAKGAGKTAIFEQIRKQRFRLKNTNMKSQIVIPIAEQLEYKSLRSLLETGVQCGIDDISTRARFLWEIYILYRIAIHLLDCDVQISRSFRKKLILFRDCFGGATEKPTLFKVLASAKKTVGFKLNYSTPGLPSPDFYISSEPASTPTQKTSKPIEHQTIHIDEYRREINKVLREQEKNAYVLIDNLDDFVAQDDYHTQKKLLQGLVQCLKAYDSYPHIHPRLFMRTDLFRKLDFSQMGGYDKIMPRCVELRWQSNDIMSFIGQRIAFNLTSYLQAPLRFQTNSTKLYLPQPRKATGMARIRQWLRSIFAPSSLLSDKNMGTRERLFRDVITTLFPRDVTHFDDHGIKDECDIFEYFSTHFEIATGETTPRIILIYLEKVVEKVKEYYRQHLEIETLSRNECNEFDFIPKECLMAAYNQVQREMVHIFKGCITQQSWQKKVDIFFQKKGKRQVFSAKKLRTMLNIGTEQELKDFLACVCHLGILRCRDNTIPVSNRMFEVPILLQEIYDA